jgi:phosphoheptose isomerase
MDLLYSHLNLGRRVIGMSSHLQTYISELISLQIAISDQLDSKLTEAGERLTHVLMEGGKIFVASDTQGHPFAQYFSEYLLVRKTQNLPSLPVMALPKETGNLTLQALATPQDCLLILQSSSDLSPLRDVLKIAKELSLPSILLTHEPAPSVGDHLSGHSLILEVPTSYHPFIHHLHLALLHTLASHIDHELFGASVLSPGTSSGERHHDLTDLD